MLFKRKAGIDILESIAIFFVIIYHFELVNYDIIDSPSAHTYICFILRGVLSVCVPLFFFINGYLLIGKEFSLERHLRKLLRIVLLTVVWSAITIVVRMLSRGELLSFEEAFSLFFGMNLYWTNHLWYLPALACIYLLFPLVKKAFDSDRRIFNIFVIMSLVFGLVFPTVSSACYALEKFTGFPFGSVMRLLNSFIPLGGGNLFSFSYFMMGAFVYANECKIDEKLRKCRIFGKGTCVILLILSAAALAVYGILRSRLNGKAYDTVWNGYDTPFVAVMVPALYFLTRDAGRCGIFIETVSKNTLGVYLTHMLFIEGFWALGITSDSFADNIIVSVMLSAVVLLLSLGTSLLLRKIPMLRKLVTL